MTNIDDVIETLDKIQRPKDDIQAQLVKIREAADRITNILALIAFMLFASFAAKLLIWVFKLIQPLRF